MNILAIDTATEACSAALLIHGDVREQFVVAPRKHSELILPMAEALLAEAGITLRQLDALAFGRGPGSFTGIRIATGVIQGIALGTGLPVVPVSTLAAIAQGVYRERGSERVIAAIDARMGEIYWGCFRLNNEKCMESVTGEGIYKPDSIPVPEIAAWAAAGSAWNTYAVELEKLITYPLSHVDGEYLPHAQDIAQLAAYGYQQGLAVPGEQAQPVYLRDQVAWKRP